MGTTTNIRFDAEIAIESTNHCKKALKRASDATDSIAQTRAVEDAMAYAESAEDAAERAQQAVAELVADTQDVMWQARKAGKQRNEPVPSHPSRAD